MPDYIYLLENRLSADQQHALRQLREVAREAGIILFLTGDAVRDLTSGHAVRDMEVAVHGNALKLKKSIEKLGGKIWGEDEASKSLYLCFPGTVRVDLVSTHSTEYPKPGKPVHHPASIQEDLRRRDFTANAMAISLNEGSFGLLMDPLNGVADIEARTLRLVSNYGFLEEPALLIRASRYKARLGWELDPRTQQRYENAREENVIEALSSLERSRELEQIGHEDDGLKVLRALETDGWMKVLFPAWLSAKADEEKLKSLHDLRVDLLTQGVHADMSAAQMEMLTSKLQPKDLAALKKQMLRHGFVEEWDSLDTLAAGFQKVLLAKENQTPSKMFKLFTSYDPEAVLWLGFTSKTAAVKDRYEQFTKVWPEAKQKFPYQQMLEMRITPELPKYQELLRELFLQLIDGKLTTPEEMKAFLEPYSPPAPPPQITIKRSRAKRSSEPKVKERSFEDEEEGAEGLGDEDLDDIGGDDEELDLGSLPKGEEDEGDEEEEDEGDEDEEEAPRGKAGKKPAAPAKAAKLTKEVAAKPTAGKPAAVPAKPAKEVKAEPAKSKAEAKPATKAAPVKSAAVKPKAEIPAKKPAPKAVPVKKAPVKAVAKKPAPKPVAKAKPAPVKKKPAAKPAKPAKKAPAKSARKK